MNQSSLIYSKNFSVRPLYVRALKDNAFAKESKKLLFIRAEILVSLMNMDLLKEKKQKKLLQQCSQAFGSKPILSDLYSFVQLIKIMRRKQRQVLEFIKFSQQLTQINCKFLQAKLIQPLLKVQQQCQYQIRSIIHTHSLNIQKQEQPQLLQCITSPFLKHKVENISTFPIENKPIQCRPKSTFRKQYTKNYQVTQDVSQINSKRNNSKNSSKKIDFFPVRRPRKYKTLFTQYLNQKQIVSSSKILTCNQTKNTIKQSITKGTDVTTPKINKKITRTRSRSPSFLLNKPQHKKQQSSTDVSLVMNSFSQEHKPNVQINLEKHYSKNISNTLVKVQEDILSDSEQSSDQYIDTSNSQEGIQVQNKFAKTKKKKTFVNILKLSQENSKSNFIKREKPKYKTTWQTPSYQSSFIYPEDRFIFKPTITGLTNISNVYVQEEPQFNMMEEQGQQYLPFSCNTSAYFNQLKQIRSKIDNKEQSNGQFLQKKNRIGRQLILEGQKKKGGWFNMVLTQGEGQGWGQKNEAVELHKERRSALEQRSVK